MPLWYCISDGKLICTTVIADTGECDKNFVENVAILIKYHKIYILSDKALQF